MTTFPMKINGIPELKYIFPTMQKHVQRVVEASSAIPKIKRVIIFGSAVTDNCGVGSDLDIAFDIPNVTDDEFLTMGKTVFL